jgi:hypothetical protein
MSNELYNLITWVFFKTLVKKHFNIDFVKIDDFFKKDTEWISLNDYEDLNDDEILNSLEHLREFEGTLYIVTDASYQKELGPFQVESANIKSFVSNHIENFGERFLETDVLIINFELKLAWIFHHEGVYALVNLK